MTKAAEATQLPVGDAGECLERLGDIVAAELLGGGSVPLPGVGKLVIKARAARTGRNPAPVSRWTSRPGRRWP